MNKTVLILGIGWEQEPLIQKLHDKGCELIGVHYNEHYTKIVDFKNVFITDLWDVNEIMKFCDSQSFDAVISDQDDYGHFLQALIAEKYNLPGPKIEQAQLSLNKLLQRQRCAIGEVKIPEFSLVTCPDDILSFTSHFGFPVILKPLDNRGSIGVVKINNEDEVFDAFQLACSNAHSHLMIVERFIKGYEVTVDGFCFPEPKSLAIAEKGKLDEKRQVSVDIKYPAELNEELYSEILENNENVADCLGYDFGFIHGEYMITEDEEIYLVELANRGGGCYTSEIILPNVSDIPVVDLYIQLCLGEIESIDYKEPSKNNVILKFFNFENGFINKINGLEQLASDENVLKHHFFVQEGTEIKNMTSDADRHGFVIVKDKANVREYCAEVINNIYIDYK
jgi:biotin carboxylase